MRSASMYHIYYYNHSNTAVHYYQQYTTLNNAMKKAHLFYCCWLKSRMFCSEFLTTLKMDVIRHRYWRRFPTGASNFLYSHRPLMKAISPVLLYNGLSITSNVLVKLSISHLPDWYWMSLHYSLQLQDKTTWYLLHNGMANSEMSICMWM